MARKNVEKPKVVVSFTIDEDVNDDVAEMARKLGMSKSSLVNIMLRGICFQEMDLLMALVGTVSNQRKTKKKSPGKVATA